MKFLSALIVIAVAIMSIVLAQDEIAASPTTPDSCGPNEFYNECGHTCQLTCATLGSPCPGARICVQGCFCKEGYVRREQYGECVLKAECGNH